MSASGQTAIRAATMFAGAVLLFLVQPVLVRSILPLFGGSAGVWTAAMLLFQAILLAGYVYAYASTRLLSPRGQALVHGALLAASLLLLPIEVRAHSGDHPIPGILVLLTAAAGLPCLLLSATSPLMQHWSAGTLPIPYRLYAVSNFGSLLALLAYPAVVEPLLPVASQLRAWSLAYAGFVPLAAVAAFLRLREPAPEFPTGPRRRPDWLWIALPACASALWLAVATHLTQDVAPVPLLWMVPLSLYLLSFVLAFSSDRWYQPRTFRLLLPAAWMGITASLSLQHGMGALRWRIPVCSAALFAICLFCHGELARRRPPKKDLAWFYVWVAAGGVLGSVFVAVVAPLAFTTYLELPLIVVLSIVLAVVLVFGYRSVGHAVRLALVGAGAFVIASHYNSTDLARVRNFYGALRVRDYPEAAGTLRVLYHGSIEHGAQFQDPARARWATAYYGPSSGGALAISATEAPARIGVIGLGVGALAAYGRPGDRFRFYEINPLVIEIARRGFTFLYDSPAAIDVAHGDARLVLEREPHQRFEVLVVDAFTGDSIPVHLITREAFALYFERTEPAGIVAVHITNKHLDLAPVVAASAEALGKRSLLIDSAGDAMRAMHNARWMLLGDEATLFKFRPRASEPPRKRVRAWTDDFSNLLAALR
jgi:hypothetical protein